MKIAVDFQSTQGQPTGIGTFAAGLFPELVRQGAGMQFVAYTLPTVKDFNVVQRIFWESVRVPMAARKDRADLIYSPGFSPAPFCRIPSVVTVHDLIGMRFAGNQGRISSLYWSKWLPSCLKRATRLIASSVSAQSDIRDLLGIAPEQVPVVPLFADAAYRVTGQKEPGLKLASQSGLTRPFFMCVGTLEPRKNVIRLLEAYAKAAQNGKPPFQLAIVGKTHDAESPLKEFAVKNSLERDVIFLGYRSREEVIALYQVALGYANVSLYEGFGLPVLEAMQCGLSGICSNRTSLPEISGESAMAVDPENVDMIAEALVNYAGDITLRRSLCERALARSKQFTVQETAKRMIAIFRETTKKAGSR